MVSACCTRTFTILTFCNSAAERERYQLQALDRLLSDMVYFIVVTFFFAA